VAAAGRVCCLALDVDGTLTISRTGFRLDLGLVEALRLVAGEVPVILVTGNSLPVAAGLARYLDIRHPVVAENGCLVYHAGRIIHVCRRSTRGAAKLLSEKLKGLLEPSWQNRFRVYDYAFTVRRGVSPREVIAEARRLLDANGYSWVRLGFSGYALHTKPPEASKARGLQTAMRLRGCRPGCTLAVGDSVLDAEMGEAGVHLAAVSNADPGLKHIADLVSCGPSSQGVAALLMMLGMPAPSGAGRECIASLAGHDPS